MKAKLTILALIVATAAWAQGTAAKKPAAKQKAPTAQTQAAKPAAKAATKPAATKSAEAKPAVPSAVRNRGKRDPFVSPVVSSRPASSTCTTGKRCLVADQVVLRGIVQSQVGMIAVVTNPANKAYFLRENDPVFNGSVVKITADSVIFRESYADRLGKMKTREVIKRVNAPAV